MTLQTPSPHTPSTSCESRSPQKSPLDKSPPTITGDSTGCTCQSNNMRVSFSIEISGGSLSWPSLPGLGNGLQWKHIFSLYRFATLALILGLSIALIPLSIAQRNHNSDWYSRHHRGRYNYLCGLSVTSLLFTFVAVMADFIRFPSSAPLWLELGLSISFSIMWLVCAILAVALHDANCVLAFIIFAFVMAYSCVLVGRAVWLSWQGADLWTKPVHCQFSNARGIKLEGDENEGLPRASASSDRTMLIDATSVNTPANCAEN